MITMNYNLDMVPGGSPVVVDVSQYDDDFQLVFNLYARLGSFSVASGSTAEIRGTKSDGNGFSAAATVSGSTVTVTGDKQMTAVAGPQTFEVVILSSAGKEIASANFTLLVERAALDYDTPQSESKLREIGDISGALKDMQTMKEYSDSSTAAAKSAKESAESASKSAESASSSASSANAAAAAADKSAKDAASSVGSTSHLQTARALQVDLSSEQPANFDGSADQTGIGVSGTLPLAHGGTGFTNAMAAANAFGNALSSYSATPVDADYYVSQHSNNGLYTTYRRPFTGLWTYVMNKISSVLGLTEDNYGGTAAKAKSVAWENVTGKPEITFAQDSAGNWGYKPKGADTVIPFNALTEVAVCILVTGMSGVGTVVNLRDGTSYGIRYTSSKNGGYVETTNFRCGNMLPISDIDDPYGTIIKKDGTYAVIEVIYASGNWINGFTGCKHYAANDHVAYSGSDSKRVYAHAIWKVG